MHPHNSSTAGPGRLTAVPEESTNGFTAVYPPRNLFRDSIRSVAVSGLQIRSTPFHYPQSSHSGSSHSNDSGASNSCPSSNTSGSSAATESGSHKLTKIARQMIKDGYIQRMIQAFEHDPGLDRALKSWFFQLDVDWVLQIHEEHGLHRQLQENSAPSFQELVDSWIRALAVIVISTQELVHKIPAVALARFCKASISAMLVFVNTIDNVHKVDKLQAVLHMHIFVLTASYDMSTMYQISPESQGIFNEIGSLLDREVNRLNKAIYSTMKEVRALIEDDYLWVIEIPQGKGDVHRNTRLMVDCIMSMVKAQAWAWARARHSARNHDPENLGGLIDDSVRYLKDLLLRKSELCSDPSLRYMFLLNNSYLVAQLFELGCKDRSRLTPECHKYMDSYLDVSWGHVLSHIQKTVFIDSCLDVSCGALMCVPKTCFHGWCQRYKKSSLAKFESKFHQIYLAQKFWKVPDPLLRDELRGAITKRVISGYRDYLKEHPEAKKHLDDGGSSPDVLEEMLGELFEG